MDTVQKAVLIGHTLIAILIIVLVLLQRGKGADAGAAFGAGASGTVFGSRGSGSFFSRMTAVFATAFFASSLTLAYLSTQRQVEAPSSLLEDVPVEAPGLSAPPGEEQELPTTELPTLDDDAAGSILEDALPVVEDELPEVDERDESNE